MKLYISPGSCSLSPHIALREAGLPFEAHAVDLRSHKLKEGGDDFYAINGKGYVPVLELDDGQRLTEGVAIVQYIADQKPGAALAPAAGSLERYRLQEWLNFISTEVHKQFSPLFNSKNSDEVKAASREKLGQRFDWIVEQLEGKDYLMGSHFTVADGYLFTILRWAPHTGVDLSRWPALEAYVKRVAARPHVHAALEAEGLVKAS